MLCYRFIGNGLKEGKREKEKRKGNAEDTFITQVNYN